MTQIVMRHQQRLHMSRIQQTMDSTDSMDSMDLLNMRVVLCLVCIFFNICFCPHLTSIAAPTVSQWLEDVAVQDTTTADIKIRWEDKTLDVSAFFSKLYGHKSKDGKTCNVRDCEVCK